MLFGSEDETQEDGGEEPCLSQIIDTIVTDKVQLSKDLFECADSMISLEQGQRRDLQVRQNRLESSLFDLQERIE